MKRENGNLNFTLKDIDERRSYLLIETNNNELISKKHKKTCKTLNYVQHLLFLASNFAGGVSIFAFASVIDVPVGVTSSVVGFWTCVALKSVSQ